MMPSWLKKLALPTSPAVPVFILGCQRSGTTICQNVFESSRLFAVFKEGNEKAMTDKWRLRSVDEIQRLIDVSKAKTLIFKPINDSQLALQLLNDFSGSRVIWIYRSFNDTVNSAVSKWGPAQRDMVVWIGEALGRHAGIGDAMPDIEKRPSFAVYAERLSDESCKRLVEWTRSPLTEQTGAAIMWYLRNELFFDQGLDTNDRALLINYENFAVNPDAELRRMCDFMGTKQLKSQAKNVHASSIGRGNVPPIDASVREACEQLFSRLHNAERSAR